PPTQSRAWSPAVCSSALVLLAAAGAMRGPDVTARVIAPFLWNQGIRRIDDVVLSHPDLDHFNGVTDLADRFAIGQVLIADSFRAIGRAAWRGSAELRERE